MGDVGRESQFDDGGDGGLYIAVDSCRVAYFSVYFTQVRRIEKLREVLIKMHCNGCKVERENIIKNRQTPTYANNPITK